MAYGFEWFNNSSKFDSFVTSININIQFWDVSEKINRNLNIKPKQA